MTLFCFVYTADSAVPYMEPSPAEDLGSALDHARRIMAERQRPLVTHIYSGADLVASVPASSASC